jgi:hypothetical protein
MVVVRVLQLFTLGLLGLIFPIASYASCPDGEERLPVTGLCKSKALEYIDSVNPGKPDGELYKGCKWTVNEGSFIDRYLIYRAAHCQGKTSQLESGAGAHAASVGLLWSALSNAETDEQIATVIHLSSTDPYKDILNYGLALNQRKGCHVRPEFIHGWPQGALVIDNKPASYVSSDGPRSACGRYGYDEGNSNHWRIVGDEAWFLMPRDELYQDIDLGSLTLLEQSPSGAWVIAKHQIFRKPKQNSVNFSTVNKTPSKKEALGAGEKTRPVDCLLQINGKKYLDGSCKYAGDKDGSFRLYGKDYFVYLNVFEKGKAEASWNADPKSTHAQVPLGDLKQKGACWVNKTTKICAWSKKPATQSKPEKKITNNKTQKAERIKFARGAFSALVTGKLDGFASEKNYLIGVGKGQTLTIEQIDMQGSQYISAYLTAPNGQTANDMDASCHSRATVSPTVAGDYEIKVVECQKADPWKGNFSLKVTVK